LTDDPNRGLSSSRMDDGGMSDYNFYESNYKSLQRTLEQVRAKLDNVVNLDGWEESNHRKVMLTKLEIDLSDHYATPQEMAQKVESRIVKSIREFMERRSSQ